MGYRGWRAPKESWSPMMTSSDRLCFPHSRQTAIKALALAAILLAYAPAAYSGKIAGNIVPVRDPRVLEAFRSIWNQPYEPVKARLLCIAVEMGADISAAIGEEEVRHPTQHCMRSRYASWSGCGSSESEATKMS